MNHSQYVLIRCLALAAVVIAVAAACFGCAAKGVTGNEWLLMQEERLDELELLADNMDEVFSLYVMGAIGSTDFLTEIELLKQQYAVMNEMYDAEKREYPILPENNSYAAQKGVEGLERVREILGAILNNAAVDGVPLPPDEAAYMYMAYKDELADNLAVYITAVQYITAATEGSDAGAD